MTGIHGIRAATEYTLPTLAICLTIWDSPEHGTLTLIINSPKGKLLHDLCVSIILPSLRQCLHPRGLAFRGPHSRVSHSGRDGEGEREVF